MFAPRAWLWLGLASMLLASSSAVFLILHKNSRSSHNLYQAYDLVNRFMHDTVRLTFKTDLNREAVFVAPVGILLPDETFNWIESFEDFKPRTEDAAPLPQAPERTLDPEWKPDFRGGL